MKKLIASLLLLGWGFAQAATFTVDFEEQSILSGGGGSLTTTLTASSSGLAWDSAVFDASWSGLNRVVFDASDLDSLAAIDNLAVTTVPMPAEVWLFGSGLAALGWFRRRNTASFRHASGETD